MSNVDSGVSHQSDDLFFPHEAEQGQRYHSSAKVFWPWGVVSGRNSTDGLGVDKPFDIVCKLMCECTLFVEGEVQIFGPDSQKNSWPKNILEPPYMDTEKTGEAVVPWHVHERGVEDERPESPTLTLNFAVGRIVVWLTARAFWVIHRCAQLYESTIGYMAISTSLQLDTEQWTTCSLSTAALEAAVPLPT